MPYPRARRDDTVDILHGTPVADPYRWLEDADRPEVQEWVAAQRDFTEAQLQHLPARGWFQDLMGRIVARPRSGVPLKRGGAWFVSRNDGRTPQDVWFTAPTLEELADGGQVVLDPNAWSEDGTASLSTLSVSRDGSLMAYARSIGGSDWQHIRVRDLITGEDLDHEVVAKFTSPAWLPDHRSFLYTTFDEADDARGTATAGLGVARLMIHRLDADDELLLAFPDEPNTMAFAEVSHDDAWLVVSIVEGTENVNRLWVYPITAADGRSILGEPIKVCDTADAEYTLVRTNGSTIYLHTDLDAPLGRVIRLELVPEGAPAGQNLVPERAPAGQNLVPERAPAELDVVSERAPAELDVVPERAPAEQGSVPEPAPVAQDSVPEPAQAEQDLVPDPACARNDPGRSKRAEEVVAETDATLTAVEPAGDGMLLAYLDDAQHRVEYRNLDGSDPRRVDLPAGALVTLDSSPLRDEAFVGLSTIATPTASFHVTVPGRASTKDELGQPPAPEPAPAPNEAAGAKSRAVAAVSEPAPAPNEAAGAKSRAVAAVSEPAPAPNEAAGAKRLTGTPFPASAEPAAGGDFTVTRHRAPSADGTPVPYFLITPNDDHTGPRPTLLYGYGGFKIPVLADYRPGWPAWLAAGGALALANLRGGGEFGTEWYDAGRLANKQRVFDDFIGVAHHLVDTGTTTSAQLAIHGRSNGGLLVGAALTQRPELFAAALPTVGVLDVLRFHKFTVGAAWMSDYGDPDTPNGLATALAYSPLHNIADGVAYPPTMVLTADHDDRVVPLHSFKFAAALQHAQAADAPIWLRVETSAGHGAGKSLQMVASEWADLLAFAAHHTGLQPERLP